MPLTITNHGGASTFLHPCTNYTYLTCACQVGQRPNSHQNRTHHVSYRTVHNYCQLQSSLWFFSYAFIHFIVINVVKMLAVWDLAVRGLVSMIIGCGQLLESMGCPLFAYEQSRSFSRSSVMYTHKKM